MSEAYRWQGICAQCHRTTGVQTRYEQGAKPLCDTCSNHGVKTAASVGLKNTDSSTTNPTYLATQSLPLDEKKLSGPGPSPSPCTNVVINASEEAGELAPVYELLALYREGDFDPEPVRLGPMPKSASAPMRAIAADLELRLGLLLAEGFQRALLYAAREAVRYGHVRSPSAASYALRRLDAEGVIWCVGEAPPLPGWARGTKLFVPPGWRPADPEEFAVVIERGDRQGMADLVWVPDEPTDPAPVAGAVEPGLELADEMVVVGGGLSHGSSRALFGYPWKVSDPTRLSASTTARGDDGREV